MQSGSWKYAWSLLIWMVLPKPSKFARTMCKTNDRVWTYQTGSQIWRLVLTNFIGFEKVVLWMQPCFIFTKRWCTMAQIALIVSVLMMFRENWFSTFWDRASDTTCPFTFALFCRRILMILMSGTCIFDPHWGFKGKTAERYVIMMTVQTSQF